MTRENPDRPIVGIGAVIFRRTDGINRVVLVRRGNEPHKGEWAIPGGVVELGETLRSAVAREAREETGLSIDVGEVVEVFERIVPGSDGMPRFHYVLIDFLCTPARQDQVIKAGSDAMEVGWFTLDECEATPMAHGTIGVLRKAFMRIAESAST